MKKKYTGPIECTSVEMMKTALTAKAAELLKEHHYFESTITVQSHDNRNTNEQLWAHADTNENPNAYFLKKENCSGPMMDAVKEIAASIKALDGRLEETVYSNGFEYNLPEEKFKEVCLAHHLQFPKAQLEEICENKLIDGKHKLYPYVIDIFEKGINVSYDDSQDPYTVEKFGMFQYRPKTSEELYAIACFIEKKLGINYDIKLTAANTKNLKDVIPYAHMVLKY